ncbi:MAG: hypothetical protein U1D30_01515 [Planctomycetota bacterium]
MSTYLDNVILFGAGASLGSDSNNVPVVTNKIFEEMCSRQLDTWTYIRDHFPLDAERLYPDHWLIGETLDTWKSAMRGLPELFAADFEAATKWILDYEYSMAQSITRDLAEYFINFCPSETSLYRRLFKRIRRGWNGAIATLNYDVLAQRAAAIEGVTLSCMWERHIQCSRSPTIIELCLPHGSAGLFSSAVEGPIYAFFSKIGAGSKPEMVLDQREWDNRMKNTNILPIMANISPQKRADIGQDFLDEQKSRFGHLVTHARRVSIIGVRVHVVDKHIWEPLARTPAQITYCSGEEAGADFDEWRRRAGRPNDRILSGYFGKEFSKICESVDLS